MVKLDFNIYGCGNMTQAIFSALGDVSQNFNFHTYTPSYTRAKDLADILGGQAYKDISAMPNGDIHFLGCKPQQINELMHEVDKLISKDSIIISILAGVKISKLDELIGGHEKIIRVMPNTPSFVGAGVSTIYYSVAINEDEQNIVESLFQGIGKVFIFSDENHIDLTTSLSGSGPAYIFELARIFENYLIGKGFSNKLAREMTIETMFGSCLLLKNQNLSPIALRNQVTSKGGVTEKALQALEESDLEKIFHNALDKGTEQVRFLSGD